MGCRRGFAYARAGCRVDRDGVASPMEWPHRWSVQGEAGCTSRVRRSWPNPDEMHDKTKEGEKCGERRDETKCLARATRCASMASARDPGCMSLAYELERILWHSGTWRMYGLGGMMCGSVGKGRATVVKLAELRRGSAKRPDASEASRAGAQTLAPVNLPSPSPACPVSPAGQHARWIAYVHGRVPESVLSSLEECQSATCNSKRERKSAAGCSAHAACSCRCQTRNCERDGR